MDNGRKKNILLGVLIVGVISMTVAFAALSTNLRLNGTANVAATRWNIHFDNWEKVSIPTAGGHTNTAEAPAANALTKSDDTNVTKVEDVNVVLHQPGDTAKYTFEIINEGTIDAKLDNFTATNTTNNDLVDYDVKCYTSSSLTGTEVTQNSVLTANGGLAYCYLQVTYKDQSNSHTAGYDQVYHQDQISTSLTAQWTWVQNDGSSAQSGGGSTPSNSYETTFNGTYGYDYAGAETLGNGGSSEWVNTLNPNVRAYMRSDGTKLETCGVFGSGQTGTVCMTSSYYNSSYSSVGNYESDFENVSTDTYDITTSAGLQATGLKGYSLSKAEEMITKGASSCYVTSSNVVCDMAGGRSCGIVYIGGVYCGDDDGNSWSINDVGSADGGGHSAP